MKNEILSKVFQRLEKGYALPALSPVAVRLIELATDESCSAKDLAALINKDASLSVRLLTLANSAFFGSSQPITTLERAVIRIGFHRLRIMALSLSLRDTFPMGQVGPLDYEKFWRSSLYRALIAKSMAVHLKSCNPDEAFVSGLILEIGLLIYLDLFLKEENKPINIDLNDLEASLAWERDTYGADHRQIGALALKYWKFPDHIIRCQGAHGGAAQGLEWSGLTGICEYARRFSLELLKNSSPLSNLFMPGDDLDPIPPDKVNQILIDTLEEVQEIANSLQIECDRDKDIIDLMEKANKTLSSISERMFNPMAGEQKHGLPSFDTLNVDNNASQTLEAVAHEIRNPLMAVGGFARKLSSVLDADSEGCKYARVILEEAARLESALNKMTHTAHP